MRCTEMDQDTLSGMRALDAWIEQWGDPRHTIREQKCIQCKKLPKEMDDVWYCIKNNGTLFWWHLLCNKHKRRRGKNKEEKKEAAVNKIVETGDVGRNV